MGESQPREKTLVLLDVHAIIHRAYHALPALTTKTGEPTGGLYGLASMLIKIIRDLKPDQILACYDLPAPTFRRAVYEEYKAGRRPTDEALISQLKASRDFFAAVGITAYEAAGFEADDLIGTLAEQARGRADWRVVIASGDHDTLQLVTGKKVVVYTLKRGLNDTIIYDETGVRERFGFAPERLVDYKGLAGDPSDNIVGVPGIGAKTATNLIVAFGGVEDIYRRLRKKPEDFREKKFSDRVQKLLLEHEEEALFSKTLATIRRDAPVELDSAAGAWLARLDRQAAKNYFERMEFRTLWPRFEAVLSLPIDGGPNDDNVVFALSPAERAVWAKARLAWWLLDSDRTDARPEEVWREVGAPDWSSLLARLETQIDEAGLTRVYREIELPLIPLVEAARARGIVLDVDYLKKLSTTYHAELKRLEQSVYQLCGVEFNLNSPKQLGEVLFDRLGLPAPRKTAGGARSTRERELRRLAGEHPAIESILDYREVQKLLSTYVDALPALVGPDGRLHTYLDQAGTTTGRMSSRDPNLQNIPASGTRGLAVRRAFVAAPGHQWLAFDYSQIEMRVLAVLSGDEQLRKIFTSGQDVHAAVAAEVFGVAVSDVTKEMRRRAKVINFGIIYGMGVRALRESLGATLGEAKKFYDGYFAKFPKIRDYFERVKREAAERGYTETWFGRRRYFSGLRSRLPMMRAAAERMAMNAPLQGTAADIVKIAMREIERELGANQLAGQTHLILQIHDELIYEVAEGGVERAAPIIRQTMEHAAAPLGLPFTANVSAGPTWADLKPI